MLNDSIMCGTSTFLVLCVSKTAFRRNRMEDVRKIFGTIEDEIKIAKGKFETTTNNGTKFKL